MESCNKQQLLPLSISWARLDYSMALRSTQMQRHIHEVLYSNAEWPLYLRAVLGASTTLTAEPCVALTTRSAKRCTEDDGEVEAAYSNLPKLSVYPSLQNLSCNTPVPATTARNCWNARPNLAATPSSVAPNKMQRGLRQKCI